MVHLSVVKVLLEVFLTPAKAVIASRTIFIFIHEEARIVEIQIHYCRNNVSSAKKSLAESWNLGKNPVTLPLSNIKSSKNYTNSYHKLFRPYLICLGNWLDVGARYSCGLLWPLASTRTMSGLWLSASVSAGGGRHSERGLWRTRGQEPGLGSTDEPSTTISISIPCFKQM